MFEKILIANRGEIACRVIRTARRMGIRTVAVCSEADQAALHVRQADEAVLIGPAPSSASYLNIDRIIDACRRTGADAVHPGYGFLSEKAQFAEALAQAGIRFIGPPAAAVSAMGDKIQSKKLAAAAGVSTVPGVLDDIADAARAVQIALEVGFPVMIKASAGGGGKGMRIARSEAEVEEGWRLARNEARSSFGDDRVFIERYIENPRHIEIQVLADSHGNIVHLGERECSIQRRHQKVIEESPSPFLDEQTRAAMGAQAVALARAVGYTSVGTVEFIVDPSRAFFFLEMNTRLQVEHPVTELVTGLDLVELMIRVAAGQPLPFTQDQVRLHGSAIEARVYAEDPARGFLPSTGRLTRYRPPEESEHVRIDTGVFEGGEISMFYDPMIAKLIGYGPDRPMATLQLKQALDAFQICGIAHNIPFLSALLHLPRFAEGRLSTNLIAEEFGDGFAGRAPSADERRLMLAVAVVAHVQQLAQERTLSSRVPRWDEAVEADWVVRVDQDNYPLRCVAVPTGFAVMVDGNMLQLESSWLPGQPLWQGFVDGQPVTMQIDRDGTWLNMAWGGVVSRLRVLTPEAAVVACLMPIKMPPDLSRFLLSPMPGLLISVAAVVGAEVKAGQELAVVEAMKMENILRAVQDGKIAAIHAHPGDSLMVDQPIIEFAR